MVYCISLKCFYCFDIFFSGQVIPHPHHASLLNNHHCIVLFGTTDIVPDQYNWTNQLLVLKGDNSSTSDCVPDHLIIGFEYKSNDMYTADQYWCEITLPRQMHLKGGKV